jgi:RNA polymerase sigma factor (sigma-70 family)
MLVDSLRPRVEKMAHYYAHRCGEDADDLLQEAWLGLLEAVPTVDVRIGSPRQYLLKRAKWRMLDAVKRAHRRRCASLQEEMVDRAFLHLVDEAVDRASVRDFLSQLRGPQRQVLECLLEGLTWREAGRVLGCTSANVAYHMRLIRKQYETWSEDREGVGC